jgi:hypothetical protein
MSFTAIQIDASYPYDSDEYNYAAYNKSGPDIENQLSVIEEYVRQNERQLQTLGGTPGKIYKAVLTTLKSLSDKPVEQIRQPFFRVFVSQFKMLSFINNRRKEEFLPK